MSKSKGKARKGKRTARQQVKGGVADGGVANGLVANGLVANGVVERLAAAQRQARPDEETTRVVVNPMAAASAEGFLANPELTPPPVFEDKDDMGDYLGEIFYARPQAGNDIALDMETLQPVTSAPLASPALGSVMTGAQVRDMIADFEDAPTLPESAPYPPSVFPEQPPLNLTAYEEEPRRSVRVNGR